MFNSIVLSRLKAFRIVPPVIAGLGWIVAFEISQSCHQIRLCSRRTERESGNLVCTLQFNLIHVYFFRPTPIAASHYLTFHIAAPSLSAFVGYAVPCRCILWFF